MFLQSIILSYIFLVLGDGALIPSAPTATSLGEFDISQEELTFMSREHDFNALQQCGGASSPSRPLVFSLSYTSAG